MREVYCASWSSPSGLSGWALFATKEGADAFLKAQTAAAIALGIGDGFSVMVTAKSVGK